MRGADQRSPVSVAGAGGVGLRRRPIMRFRQVDRSSSRRRRVSRQDFGLPGRRIPSYKQSMVETTYFPRRLILAGAMISGVLLALAVHMLGARYGLALGRLWQPDQRQLMPTGAAPAGWLIAPAGFVGGFFTATLMHSAVSGQIPQ